MDKKSDMTPFFSADYSLTTSFLARAVVNNVLTGDCVTNIADTHDAAEKMKCVKLLESKRRRLKEMLIMCQYLFMLCEILFELLHSFLNDVQKKLLKNI